MAQVTVLSWYLPRRMAHRKIMKNVSQDNGCPGWDSTGSPSKSKSKVLVFGSTCLVSCNEFYISKMITKKEADTTNKY
jgi:hypothetical protein